jgi:hypothetical protein
MHLLPVQMVLRDGFATTAASVTMAFASGVSRSIMSALWSSRSDDVPMGLTIPCVKGRESPLTQWL